ncbi:MAG: diaminopimelate epimerase [Candidatus Binatia bacterium]|nr:diaminopimelate epimerase [Candidatus Binatia bacterium]
MRLPFTKMHGIGNDYVYVDAFQTTVEDPPAVARQVSPRNTAIGSDGLILIAPSDVADCRMEMYNADGSRGEMCGNGIRCVGKYAYDHGIAPRKTLRVETDAGVKELTLRVRDGRVYEVTVDMGEPGLDPATLPMKADGQVIDSPIEIDGRQVNLTAVSMGNPHVVTFVDSTEDAPVTTFGPVVERDALFPRGVNIEFVELLAPAPSARLRMRVWERGSGETAACGTGACAVAVAGVLTDRGTRDVEIELLGGNLQIEWRESDGHVYMTGPAAEVFSGEIDV